mmetsp:Transcript_8346/g.27828  ORF Transcript_8346/g.27828 Transcript_8346/m.27828 type:complete len:212 (+) Transcript_8346:2018-2653(+)
MLLKCTMVVPIPMVPKSGKRLLKTSMVSNGSPPRQRPARELRASLSTASRTPTTTTLSSRKTPATGTETACSSQRCRRQIRLPRTTSSPWLAARRTLVFCPSFPFQPAPLDPRPRPSSLASPTPLARSVKPPSVVLLDASPMYKSRSTTSPSSSVFSNTPCLMASSLHLEPTAVDKFSCGTWPTSNAINYVFAMHLRHFSSVSHHEDRIDF